MSAITLNGISVCPTAEERYVFFDLLPRIRRKGVTVNTITATRTERYFPRSPPHSSDAEPSETNGSSKRCNNKAGGISLNRAKFRPLLFVGEPVDGTKSSYVCNLAAIK